MSDSTEANPISLADYDYVLPSGRIAQEPIEPRDAARLLVISRATGEMTHGCFRELDRLLEPGDLLVMNETRVSALRLLGRRSGGGEVEALVLRPAIERGVDIYEALVRPGRKLRTADQLRFEGALAAEVQDRTAAGGRYLRFFREDGGEVSEALTKSGQVPLPPYISAPLRDRERYQTVYARVPGSAAAPTAGLHFTQELLNRLRCRNIGIATVRLEVGLGTFRPIRTDDVRQHEMHEETFAVSAECADAVNACRGRVVAVGTTSLRALESAADGAGDGRRIAPRVGATRLFILPGYRFRAVDGLITNFHQPHSTLLLLVGAFIGRERLHAAYSAALEGEYRFLSFGDAMLAL